MDRGAVNLSRVRAGILAFAVAIWASTLGAKFTFDDRLTIEENEVVTGPFSLKALFGHDFWGYDLGAPGAPSTYRPLVTASYWLDWHLGGGKPWLFHLTNLVVFVATLLVIDRFLRTFAKGLSEGARMLALAAFAAVAIHVDVVPSATGRTEMVALIFTLLACERACVEEKRPRDVALAFVFMILALLSKESALPMGIFVAYLAVRRRERSSRGATAGLALAGVLPVCALIGFRLAMHMPMKLVGEEFQFANPLYVASTSHRLHGAVQGLGHYVEHFAAPIDLCPDYGYAALVPHRTITHATVVGALAIVSLLAVVAAFRRFPVGVDAAIGFGASYVVVSNVLSTASTFVADRVFFGPSFWLIAVIALLLDDVLRDRARRLAAFALAGLIGLQGLVAAIGATMWRDNHRLGGWAVRACPAGFTLRMWHAATASAERQYDEAAWSLLVAADIFPRFPEPIPEALIDGAWEDESVDKRVALFRAARAPAEFARSCAAAQRLATNIDHGAGTRAALSRWCGVTGSAGH